MIFENPQEGIMTAINEYLQLVPLDVIRLQYDTEHQSATVCGNLNGMQYTTELKVLTAENRQPLSGNDLIWKVGVMCEEGYDIDQIAEKLGVSQAEVKYGIRCLRTKWRNFANK